MSGRSELHDWWMEMAALTRRGTRLLLSQIGGSRGDNGEFLDVVVGRFLLLLGRRLSAADNGGRVGGVKGFRREQKASVGCWGG